MNVVFCFFKLNIKWNSKTVVVSGTTQVQQLQTFFENNYRDLKLN